MNKRRDEPAAIRWRSVSGFVILLWKKGRIFHNLSPQPGLAILSGTDFAKTCPLANRLIGYGDESVP